MRPVLQLWQKTIQYEKYTSDGFLILWTVKWVDACVSMRVKLAKEHAFRVEVAVGEYLFGGGLSKKIRGSKKE